MSLEWGNNATPSRNRVSLDKRPPRSTKYSDVKSRVDTGSTIQKLKSVTSRQVNKRRDETFFRITCKELSDLLSEYESEDLEEDIHLNKGFADFNPRVVIHDQEAEVKTERPYLILDLRNEIEFQESHIMQSRCFPQRYLMQDKSSKELVKFKSIEGKLIVLYDDSQQNRLATAAAHTLSARGFDNIFVLVGGISEFANHYEHQIDGRWQQMHDKGSGRKSSSNPASSSNYDNSQTNHSNRGKSEYGGRSSRSEYGEGTSGHKSNYQGSDTRSQMSSIKSQCQSSRSSHLPQLGPQYIQTENTGGLQHGRSQRNYQQQSYQLAQYQRKSNKASGFDENDERASRMSNVSVADSVISRAQQRKVGGRCR